MRKNGDFYEKDAELHLFDCLKAIVINDGREVWVIDPVEFQIRNYVDEMCIGYEKSKGNDLVTLKDCSDPKLKKKG